MHPTAERFRHLAERRHGLDLEVHAFPQGTKTAQDAADAIGCTVDQIVKSVVIKTPVQFVVVLTSGAHRVDTAALAEHYDVAPGSVRSAEAGEVKELLGWSIGGVPPFGHLGEVPVLMDPHLLTFDEVWAAAGTPNTVFPMDPEVLREVAQARPRDGIFEEA